MGRMGGIKWERSVQCRPAHNIISSDFPKYVPQQWKFMEGDVHISLIIAHEYQRMWIAERDAWKKRMYPENVSVNVDVVKRYILTFKNNVKPKKPEEKKPFKMKKFEGAKSKTVSKRPKTEPKAKVPETK